MAVTTQEKSTMQRAADTAKDAASRVGDVAQGAVESAGKMASDAASFIGKKAESAAKSVAGTVESGAHYLSEHSISEMGGDVANLIRKNPVPALLIAVGVGFLFARAIRG